MTPSDISAFRKQYGFSQQEIADAIGVTRGPLSAIERGAREISSFMETLLEDFFAFVRECDAQGRLGNA